MEGVRGDGGGVRGMEECEGDGGDVKGMEGCEGGEGGKVSGWRGGRERVTYQ